MLKALACVMLPALLTGAAVAQPTQDPMRASFDAPPAEARPWVWWHWLDGNITVDGIDRDIAWMKRIGIAGFQLFDVAQPDVPQSVERRLIYLHPEWKSAFRHAIAAAADAGLQAGIASSPGWSETGGPWVPAAAAMKKLVWSETAVDGGRRFVGRLAQPPAVAGPFLDIARGPDASATLFYRDIAVLAWRTPADAAPQLPAKVSASGGTIDASLLADPRLDHVPAAVLPLASGSPQWIRFDYDRPQTMRSLVYAPSRPGVFDIAPDAVLEVSDDGMRFRAARKLALSTFNQTSLSFPPVTGRSFRIVFVPSADAGFLWRRVRNLKAPGIVNTRYDQPPAAQDLRVQRLALLGDARVNRFEAKAGFVTAPDYYAIATPPADPGSVITAAGVIDLSRRIRADGTLDWTPPAGRWTVLRLGYSLTGATNGPAPAESVGYEVDKLDAAYVGDYMSHYLQLYRDMLGPELLGTRGVSMVLTDSIEAGPQNWTDAMIAEFRRRRGYDPTRWLPALTGRIIGSAEASDRFLWDYRATIAELLAANHYRELAARAHAAGLSIRGEALEDHRPILGNDMAMRSHADEPAGAIWAPNAAGHIEPTSIADLKGAASIAHLHGRRFVAAEAFTAALAPWAGSPRTLKPVADAALALGVTRFMLHSTVHQPDDAKQPGLALGIFGQYFNRHESWAEQARPWIDYLARSAWLLQQGRYGADIAYFFGEEAPLTGLYGEAEVADVPNGHGYDFVDADTLLHLVEVRDGWFVVPSGMRYRALQLGGTSSRMTLSVLRRIAALVDAGGVVVGRRPAESPSLADDPAQFARLAGRLWRSAPNAAGGRVLDLPPEQAMIALGITPDWQALNPDAPPLMVLHRILPDGDIYFVSSRSPLAARAEIAFRVTGRVPERWDADSGEVTPLPYRVEGGRTIVPLVFDPNDAAFVVFRDKAASLSREIAAPVETVLADLSDGWTLGFQPNRGGPETPVAAAAGAWNVNADPRIRYFSGTGTYRRNFVVPRHSGGRVLLDLGGVGELAEVIVNGRMLRTLWKPPYRLDITAALRAGRNRVELRVTNLWVNRLIGDAQHGAVKIAWTPMPTYRADAPLHPSGLIGPVRLLLRR